MKKKSIIGIVIGLVLVAIIVIVIISQGFGHDLSNQAPDDGTDATEEMQTEAEVVEENGDLDEIVSEETEDIAEKSDEEIIADLNTQLDEANTRLAEIEASELEHAQAVQAVKDKITTLKQEYGERDEKYHSTSNYISSSVVLYNSNLLTIDDMMSILGVSSCNALANELEVSSGLLSGMIGANITAKSGDKEMYYDGVFDAPDIAKNGLPIGTKLLVDQIINSTDVNDIEYVRIMDVLAQACIMTSQSQYTLRSADLKPLVKDYTLGAFNLNESGYFIDGFITLGILSSGNNTYIDVNDELSDLIGTDIAEYYFSIGGDPDNQSAIIEGLQKRQSQEQAEQNNLNSEKSDLNQLIEELSNALSELQ